MIERGEPAARRPWRRAALGAAAAAFALARPGSIAGGIAWAAALVIACGGFGVAIERATRQRVSEGLTIAIGFCALLLGSLLIARAGLLGRGVQIALVIAGIAGTLLARRDRAPGAAPGTAPEPPPRAAVAFAVVAGIAAVAIALVRLDPVVADGMNHAFAIKRLWDTGGLVPQYHQLGLQLIGESYAALQSGADAAAAFESGLCVALVLVLCATELAVGGRRTAAVRFGLAALPIALQPDLTQWSAVVIQLAAVWCLGPAIAARRTGWHAIIAAAALLALRFEYALLVAPCLAAAIALPREPRITRRTAALAIAGWLALIVAVEVALATGLATAVRCAVILLAALPLTALALRLAALTWRSPLAALWFGTITTHLALALEAIRTAQHSAATDSALWLAAGLATLAAVDLPEAGTEPGTEAGTEAGAEAEPEAGPGPAPGARPGRLGGLAAAAVVAGLGAGLIVAPVTDGADHAHLVQRFSTAAIALRDRLRLEPSDRAHAEIRALQDLVPARARLGFWGSSAAQLDFRRNPVHDVSWPRDRQRRRDAYYQRPLQREDLFGLDYLIVEGLRPRAAPEPWTEAVAPPTHDVEAYLAPIASQGAARLYRIGAADPAR